MGPGDAILAGFADVFVPEADWPALAEALVATGDPAAIAAATRPAPEAPLGALREAIDDAFEARRPRGDRGAARDQRLGTWRC